jgi:hypothetical protein
MSSRKLDDLVVPFRTKVFEFIARCAEAGIPVMIVETLRSLEEHKRNLALKRSWVAVSKHCSGQAIDVCPYDVYQLSGPDKLKWDGNATVWQIIGVIGEKCGLRWGGRWKVKDMCHFEY